MAAKLENTLGATTELIVGSGGVFDVKADGNLVYSKHDVGDFPVEDSLVAELSAS